jgi:hypothetical protein
MLDHEMTPNEIANAIAADLTGVALEYWNTLSESERRAHILAVLVRNRDEEAT